MARLVAGLGAVVAAGSAPLDWDEDLIRGLQSLASRGCSPVLDVLGVRHLVEGNVLVLPGHRLLVAEACSGVNSLFTLLIATALFVVGLGVPLVRSVLLLAGSVFWAGLMNMLRVVTVALAQSWCGVDLSCGLAARDARFPHRRVGDSCWSPRPTGCWRSSWGPIELPTRSPRE